LRFARLPGSTFKPFQDLANGGTRSIPAEVLRFARRELFAPLGMHHVTL
jgi:hypothetical protein